MDGQRFDALTRVMAAGTTRRSALRAIAGLATGIVSRRGARAKAQATCPLPGEACSGSNLCCEGTVCLNGTCCSFDGDSCNGVPSNCCSGICDVGGSGLCVQACIQEGHHCGNPGDFCCEGLICNETSCVSPDTCLALGEECFQDRDCCDPNICSENLCSSPDCGGDGVGCEDSGDCCGILECVSGACQQTCGFSGDDCSGDGDCCETFACHQHGFCTRQCPNPGADCDNDSDCCSADDFCSNGTCQPRSTCRAFMESCVDSSECCSDAVFLECIFGLCQVPECLPEFAFCTENDQCCSNVCQGFACSGACGGIGDACAMEAGAAPAGAAYACCQTGLRCLEGTCASCRELAEICGGNGECCGDLECIDGICGGPSTPAPPNTPAGSPTTVPTQTSGGAATTTPTTASTQFPDDPTETPIVPTQTSGVSGDSPSLPNTGAGSPSDGTNWPLIGLGGAIAALIAGKRAASKSSEES
jgi:hypothetical protein